MLSKIDLSIIITIANNQKPDKIQELFSIYKNRIESTGYSYEFIYVVDDLPQNILNELNDLSEKGENIKIIKLAKWFGDAAALSIGFEEASGKIILTLPPVMQVEDKVLPDLLDSLKGADMVIARRKRRKDNILQRFQARIFHYLVRLTIGMQFHDLGCRVRVFKREILENINLYGDQIRFFPLLAARYGFKVKEMDVEQYKTEAVHGVYSLGHYTERIVDLVSIFFLIKFTRKPLRFFGLPGVLIFGIGSILALYLFIQRAFMGVALADRPIVLVSILLIVFGIQLFAIGLVAEIIIFTHSKDSKEYIVEKVIDNTSKKFAKEVDTEVKESI
jgi:glycosyltransferase involved in cell wall biosynthesis